MVGEKFAFFDSSTIGNISDANGFIMLKIYQEIGLGGVSLSLKFHVYNCQGWGEIAIFRFPIRLALSI